MTIKVINSEHLTLRRDRLDTTKETVTARKEGPEHLVECGSSKGAEEDQEPEESSNN